MKRLKGISRLVLAGTLLVAIAQAASFASAQSIYGAWVDDRGQSIVFGQDHVITLTAPNQSQPYKRVRFEYHPHAQGVGVLVVEEPDGSVGQWEVHWQSPDVHVEVGPDGQQSVFRRAGGGVNPYGPPNMGPQPVGPQPFSPQVGPRPIDPYEQAEIDEYKRDGRARRDAFHRREENDIAQGNRLVAKQQRELDRHRKQRERDNLAGSLILPGLSQTPIGAPVGRVGGQAITEGIRARNNFNNAVGRLFK